MKKESLWMLLVTRISRDEEEQQRVLREFQEAFAGNRLRDYLILLRASFMGPREMEERRGFFLALGSLLMDHLKQKSELAAGPYGLYIGFIADDLAKLADEELARTGKALGVALRLATNPPTLRFSIEGPLALPPCPMSPAEVRAAPEAWVEALGREAALWRSAQLLAVRDHLPAGPADHPMPQRRRAHALLLIGAYLEQAQATDWAHRCYLAATCLDPSYDLPWAFLALAEPDPKAGLAAAHKALAANPRSLPGLINRGTLLARLGRSDEALRDFAEAARYDQANPRLLLQCAHAALEAGQVEIAVKLFVYVQRAFPAVPEAWFGLARLFWKAGLIEMARRCQERFRTLRHGNVPRELRLVGRLRVEAKQPGQRVQVDQEWGVTPWDLPEVMTGEHRIAWENGPVRKIMVDEGDAIRASWVEGKADVDIVQFTPEPVSWRKILPDGTVTWLPSKEILAPWLVDDLDRFPAPEPLVDILAAIPQPVTPFPGDTRLTVESVFRILLEEILADGILDRTESEMLRAIRERLLIDPTRYEAIMKEARARASSRTAGDSGPVDTRAIYGRLYAKALEDSVLEDSERLLLETVAEALLLLPSEVAEIEAAAKKR